MIPLVIHANGYNAYVDLLYWKTYEKGVVLTNETSPIFTTNNFTLAPVIHPQFDWDFGCRLGIGMRRNCSDISLDWTYYPTTIQQHRETDSNNLTNISNPLGMFPIWSLSEDTIAGDYVTDAQLKWDISLNQVDLKWTKLSVRYRNLDLRPYLGLTTAFINQNAHIEYSGGIFFYQILDGGVNVDGVDHIHMKNNFWGIGPKIGFEPRWNLFGNFSLFGNAAISGLVGIFHIDQKETFLDVERFSHHENSARLRWIGDLAAGIAWDKCICNYLVQWQLSWEYHIFFHQLELQEDDFGLIPSNRNLSFQGLVLSGNFYF